MMQDNTYYVDPETGFIVHDVNESGVSDESVSLESPADETNAYANDIYMSGSDVSETSSDLEESQSITDFVDGVVVHITPADGPVVLSADGSVRADGMVVYDLTVSGYGSCKYVVSPADAEKLEVADGQLINWGSSDVSGSLYQGNISSPAAIDTLRLTLLGRGSANYASNFYRYGSPQYVTYYTQNGAYLQNNQTYVSLSDVEQETWSFSYWFFIIALVCLLLLAVNAVIRLIRRGLGG